MTSQDDSLLATSNSDIAPPSRFVRWIDHPRMQNIAHLATTVGAIIGTLALVVAANQLRLSAGQSREQSALQREIAANGSWERYMEMASGKPHLAIGREYTKLSAVEKVEYVWFVDRMLFAGEQALTFDPGDTEWQLAVQTEAARHTSYLGHPDFLVESMCSFTRDLRMTVARAFTHTNKQLAT